jgi:hypothetical protein
MLVWDEGYRLTVWVAVQDCTGVYTAACFAMRPWHWARSKHIAVCLSAQPDPCLPIEDCLLQLSFAVASCFP